MAEIDINAVNHLNDMLIRTLQSTAFEDFPLVSALTVMRSNDGKHSARVAYTDRDSLVAMYEAVVETLKNHGIRPLPTETLHTNN